MSFVGFIVGTQGEQVEVAFDIDKTAAGGNRYGFAPATGNLMYCMPQKGTKTSLYIGNGDEAQGIATGCIRTNGSTCEGTGSPEKKSFRSEHGKGMDLYPQRMGLDGLHHGLGKTFTGYDDYFGGDVDEDALTYLALANRVIHEVRPDALTVAEDVSGMPGLAAPASGGGIGFDCRMAMGVTDMWFKLFDLPDQDWNMFYLFHELTNRRRDERSISYVESHDQAIVGGKTAIFRLADAAMYDAMHAGSQNLAVDRAIALHKMIRLATAAAAGHGYLNFMGNEFGHPEWIDFPREGNGWSLQHARRQWSLADEPGLRYHFLRDFDRAMLEVLNRNPEFFRRRVQTVRIDDCGKVLIFERDDCYFCFNFHPENSYFDYGFEVLPGEFETVLDSDAPEFGGFSRRAPEQRYWSRQGQSGAFITLYLPSRTALVLKRI